MKCWFQALFENGVSGILADEMGLGKTIQVIALLCHLYEKRERGPFMILAPLSTLPNWLLEFQQFAPQVWKVEVLGLIIWAMLLKALIVAVTLKFETGSLPVGKSLEIGKKEIFLWLGKGWSLVGELVITEENPHPIL